MRHSIKYVCEWKERKRRKKARETHTHIHTLCSCKKYRTKTEDGEFECLSDAKRLSFSRWKDKQQDKSSLVHTIIMSICLSGSTMRKQTWFLIYPSHTLNWGSVWEIQRVKGKKKPILLTNYLMWGWRFTSRGCYGVIVEALRQSVNRSLQLYRYCFHSDAPPLYKRVNHYTHESATPW